MGFSCFLTIWWLLLLAIGQVSAEGNVGCLFHETACDPDEFCFDDNAFGRCLSADAPPEDRYRHDLSVSTLRLLETEMKRLFFGGYRWNHAYTQCVIQNILNADREGLSYDPGLCARVLKLTLPEVPPALVEELEQLDPEQMASIKFDPESLLPGEPPDFATEIFEPPVEDAEENGDAIKEEDNNDVAIYREYAEPHKRRKKQQRAIGHSVDGDAAEQHHAASDGDGRQRARNYDRLLTYLRQIAAESLDDSLASYRDYQHPNTPPTKGAKASSTRNELLPISEQNWQPLYTEGGLEWVPSSAVNGNFDDHRTTAAFRERGTGLTPISSEDAADRSTPLWTSQTASRYFPDDPLDIDVRPSSAAALLGHNRHFTEDVDDRGQSGNRDNQPALLFNPHHDDDNGVWSWPDEEITVNEQPEVDGEWRDFVEPVGPGSWQQLSGNVGLPENDGENSNMPGFERHHRYDTKKPGPRYYVHEPESSEELFQESLLKARGFLPHSKQQNALSNTRNFARAQVDTPEAWRTSIGRAVMPHPSAGSSSNPSIDGERGRVIPGDSSQHDEDTGAVTMATESREDPIDIVGQKEGIPDYGIQSNSGEKRALEPPSEAPLASLSDKPAMSGNYETIDATHAFLLMSGDVNLQDGEELVKKLEQVLYVPRGTFSNIRVEKNQVTFKVNPNPKGLNASAVASKAEDFSDQLKTADGKSLLAAGIGDKTKFEVVGNKQDDRRLIVWTFILCGLVVGILLAAAIIYIIRRHARFRQKLQSLAQPETEANQDYQDLCRQRMASKSHDKPEAVHVTQSPKRVSSLCQTEPAQPSPSSRSSTSSWSEEPVTSNMDISTGHLILSYMEDHLKNKDRLDREWEALCAYEAEPCTTNAALLPQNVKKNRYPDVLPYDHSRVILNDLANISGSDYINASTITDHDPRNPAYIATQGPLPHTAADFWQMIWEQGSVVIVMLTRLMENGVAMCHRYWPEEGSEVYHVYEVHLVSEHIWCDDYLVRSFYLKNLKTCETRTVTQFHFLSWPDNGVPSSTKAILEFRRKVNKSYRGRSCPIVVHCSDGIGRSGTYCLIDMVLNRMAKGTKEIDIAATLEHIRDQRGGMVKTKAQFEFVLMSIAEEVHAILKALSH